MKFNDTSPTADYSYQKTSFVEDDAPRRKQKSARAIKTRVNTIAWISLP
jgi:hypothetical protein